MRLRIAILLSIISSAGIAQDAPKHEGRSSPANPTVGSGVAVPDPAMRETLVPALAAWIAASRDSAIARGVAAIPDDIRAALNGYIPDDILDRVRWRIDDSVLSVLQALFRFRYTPAVTLDDVVIFAHASGAADPKLWAHELVHVMQYREWGIDGFAERYLADYESVERGAYEFRWQWMKATGRVPRP